MLNKSSLITNICFAIDNCFPHQKVSRNACVFVRWRRRWWWLPPPRAQNVWFLSFTRHCCCCDWDCVIGNEVKMRVSVSVYAEGTCDFVVHLQLSCARCVSDLFADSFSSLMTACVQNCAYAIQSHAKFCTVESQHKCSLTHT